MEQVRVGIVGIGRLGFSHAEKLAYRIPGAKLAAICKQSGAGLREAGEALGVPSSACYTDYSRMLGQADIDAVVVASPSSEHPGHIAQALESGKHVFTEKPLGTTVAACREAERAVYAHPEQVFMIGFMRRYDASYAYAKQQIDAGRIGTPYLFKGTGVDPMQSVEEMLRYVKVGSGAIFSDLGTHDIDLMRWYLGEDPVEVHAIGGSYAYGRFREIGDAEAACAMFRFSSGKMALMHCGRAAAHGYHIETEIVGTAGSIHISPVPEKNLAKLYGADGVKTECVESFCERFDQAYLAELTEFIDCIRTKRSPAMCAADGTKAAIIALCATESFHSGKPVTIPYDAAPGEDRK